MDIQLYRRKVEETYLGFKPNTYSVKPVHIANGLFKGLTGKKANVKNLYNLIYTGNAKGIIKHDHHKTKNVYMNYVEKNAIDTTGVDLDNFLTFRTMARKIICADGAVFGEGMVSFTAANINTLGTDTIAQDGGKLFAYTIKKLCPELFDTLTNWIKNSDDLISTIFLPAFSEEFINDDSLIVLDEMHMHYLNQDELKVPFDKLIHGMSVALKTLNMHLQNDMNKLSGIRLVVLLGCYWLIRQLCFAEALYCKNDNNILPLLLDFSETANEPIAKASMMNYTLLCQSIARFYAEKIGEVLKERYTITQLLNETTPKYNNKEANVDVWKMVQEDVSSNQGFIEEDKLYTKFGAAIYDMLALEASSNPVKYIRSLGMRSGIFYPPSNNPPTKRFLPSQDTFEAIIRSLIEPGEIVNIKTIKDRLWDRHNIIIGGRTEDLDILNDSGLYQVDEDALKNNNEKFVKWLKDLDFARIMADGVLQIRMGG